MDLSLSDDESSSESDDDDDESISEDDSNEFEKLTDWGKKKKSYHKYSDDSEDENEDEDDLYDENLDEEAEVIRIQKLKSSKKTEEDYDDTLGYIAKTKDVKKSLISSKDRSIIQSIHQDLEELSKEKKDLLKNLSSEQKRSVLNKEYPKFMSLIDEFKKRVNELNNRLSPSLKILTDSSTLSGNILFYIRRRYQTLLKFCASLCFYFLLVAEGKKLQGHPVLDKLEELQNSISEYAPFEKKYKAKIKDILAQDNLKPSIQHEKKSTSNKKKKKVTFEDGLNDPDSDLEYYRSIEEQTHQKKAKLKEEKDRLENYYEYRDIEEVEGKRKITREILKNIGLRRKRKREDRNPRVKNRRKYDKALKRRKGQVTPMRDQSKPYSGEETGINKNTVKAIRLG